MDKQSIKNSLKENYTVFINYMNELSEDEYVFRFQQKWTAAQQLEHIVICVKPLLQVFNMDKTAIEKTFGKSTRENYTYENLLNSYKEKLQQGGKAPARYVPEASVTEQRKILCETLTKLIAELNSKIENFSEEELNTLLIPHPLLGNLTLREMLYNAIYHVQHHQEQAKQNLKNK